MSYGSKPEDSGSWKILRIMQDNGTVLWEVDISPKDLLPLTMTSHEAVIPLEELTLLISIQCVPSTITLKEVDLSKSTKTGSNDNQILRNIYDAIYSTDPGESFEVDNS